MKKITFIFLAVTGIMIGTLSLAKSLPPQPINGDEPAKAGGRNFHGYSLGHNETVLPRAYQDDAGGSGG
jgi:hypothetical protein